MTEQRTPYTIEDDNSGDTEPMQAVVKIEQSQEKSIGKSENMHNQLCDYLANNLIWVKALTHDQACTLLYTLVTQHPDAVTTVIERAEAEEARKAQDVQESQGS